MTRTIRAPRGAQITCKNWLIEAAYRMLQNNLDPQVAGDPENLIVYGGRGKAARNWESFDAILDSLRALEPDETLLGLIMFGQMTAGSWIYIGTQGILQGTYETLGALARQHGWGSLKGRLVLTAGTSSRSGMTIATIVRHPFCQRQSHPPTPGTPPENSLQKAVKQRPAWQESPGRSGA